MPGSCPELIPWDSPSISLHGWQVAQRGMERGAVGCRHGLCRWYLDGQLCPQSSLV